MAASLKALIPSDVMSAMVEETFRKSLVFGSVVNTKYEGVVASAGDSVLIPVIGDVTISTHTVNDTITYEALDAANAKLTINVSKRFAFSVDDCDSRQSIVNVAAAYADRAAYLLKDNSDQYIAALHSEAGVTSNLGTTAVPLTVTAAASTGGNISAYEVMSRLHKGLDDKNVPREGRWLVAPPWFIAKLTLAGILTVPGTSDQEAATNGRIGYRMGFDIRVSTNVVNGTSGTGSKIMAGTNAAITYVGQILNVETLRLETHFGTGVRGLLLYGAKVIQPDSLAVCTGTDTTG